MVAVSLKKSFFQAEDGIRDVERSRGLGDVYKRQEDDLREAIGRVARFLETCRKRFGTDGVAVQAAEGGDGPTAKVTKIGRKKR